MLTTTVGHHSICRLQRVLSEGKKKEGHELSNKFTTTT